nr:hypothetical protein [Candidatus Dojkabacteria bacterium]
MALNKFISTQGYKSDSPDKNNPYNIIPSGRITMNNVPHPVYGIDNLGNSIYMQPGGEYQFPGDQVFEVPMHMMPDGTMMPNSEHPGYEEMELTDEEIAQYRAGGYIVEMQDGGQTTRTIPVSNPDDPRLHMYLDSLNLYKGYQKAQELFPEEKFPGTNPSSRWSEQMRARPNDKLKEQNYWDPNFQDPDINYFNSFDESWAHKAEFDKLVDKYKEGPLGSTNWDKLQADPMYKRIGANKMTAYKNTKDLMQDETKSGLLSKYYDENLKFRYPTSTGYWNTPDLGHSKIKQSDSYYSGAWNPIYKKPVQPYEYIGDPADVEALRHPAKISG